MIRISLSRKYKTDLLVFFFFLLFLPLFLYNLGGYSLADFDEGWFAEVGRNVLVNREPIILTFNNAPFTEHPPLGFNLIAISYLIFGISEFAARFPSAILGWGCLILTYLIGKNLINKWVGIGASLMLVSSVWFMFRARSGNLDTVFLFFFLLTFYAGIKAKSDKRWIYGFAVSFAAVILVKSVLGISILLPVFVFWILERVKIPKKQITQALLLFIVCLTPWIVRELQVYGGNYFSHMISVGLRKGDFIVPNLRELSSQTTLQYLHFGIGKWYLLAIISLLGLLIFRKKLKRLLPIYALVIFLLFGFLTNAKTEIWHLIPLYPFLGLLIASFLYMVIYRFLHHRGSHGLASSACHPRGVLKFLLLIPIFSLAFYQIYQFRNNIKLADREVNGLAAVSSAARNYKEDLYLDSDYFLPSPVFYGQKEVKHIRGLGAPRNLLKGFITEASSSSLLLTQSWRLQLDKVDGSFYETLAQKDDWMLIKLISPASK